MEAKSTSCIDHGGVGNKDGYLTTSRNIGGVRKMILLHRYVYFKTHGVWPEICRHTCDNSRCINPDHLVNGTVQDNIADAVARGRLRKGEAHGMSKLTEADAASIRRRYRYRSRDANSYVLAREYGVSQGTIMQIVKGVTWSPHA